MFWNLIKLNLLFCLFALPSAALMFVCFFVPNIFIFLLSLLAAFPVGGAYTSCLFCLSKMQRRDAGYLWYDFKRKFLENIKQSAAPGILCVAFIYAQIYIWQSFLLEGAGLVWIVTGLVPLLIFGMVAPYIFLQIAYIRLKTPQILKNSLLISFGNAGRSFLGALAGGLIWFVFVLLLPDSLPFSPLLLILGFSVSWFLTLALIWPPVDKLFAIEENLRKQRTEG